MAMLTERMPGSCGECVADGEKFIYLADISSAETPLDLALELLNPAKPELLNMGC